jgi:hypothetical protein
MIELKAQTQTYFEQGIFLSLPASIRASKANVSARLASQQV